jgi:hypothetical protein
MAMTEAIVDIDDSPCPPYPWSTFEKIGEFFYLFSILDKWTCDCLMTIGGYSEDRILKMMFAERIKHWKSIRVLTEPCCSHADALYMGLCKLRDDRNSIAHACWRQHEDELYGIFAPQANPGEAISINGNARLDEMIANAKHCMVIIFFGLNEPSPSISW